MLSTLARALLTVVLASLLLPARLGAEETEFGAILAAAALPGTPLVGVVLGATGEGVTLRTRPARLAIVDTDSGTARWLLALPAGAATLAADAETQRFFAASPRELASIDARTGDTRTAPLPTPLEHAPRLTFNPATGRLYASTTGGMSGGRHSDILDRDGQPLGELDAEVMAVDASLNHLYAAADLPLPPPLDTYRGLRLLALDGASHAVLTPNGFFDMAVPAPMLRGLLASETTHRVLALTSHCFAKCIPPTLSVYDGQTFAAVRQDTVAAPETLDLLNDATGTAYGRTRWNGAFYDGQDIQTGAVRARWHLTAGSPLAADPLRNRLYLGRTHQGSLALAIADGTTEAITSLAPLGHAAPPPAAAPVPPPAAPSPDRRYFAETGHSLAYGFKAYWEQHGGLDVFGYPLTEELDEPAPDWPVGDGQVRTVQYFERARFEYHPEHQGTPYEVQLQLLGLQFAAVRAPLVVDAPDTPERRFFPETGHTLAYGFKYYWDTHGGLPVFGLPITEEFRQVSLTDGQAYTVQYFERARFEYHPEHQGTPYEVELGLLGRQELTARSWLPR